MKPLKSNTKRFIFDKMSYDKREYFFQMGKAHFTCNDFLLSPSNFSVAQERFLMPKITLTSNFEVAIASANFSHILMFGYDGIMSDKVFADAIGSTSAEAINLLEQYNAHPQLPNIDKHLIKGGCSKMEFFLRKSDDGVTNAECLVCGSGSLMQNDNDGTLVRIDNTNFDGALRIIDKNMDYVMENVRNKEAEISLSSAFNDVPALEE